MVYKDLISFHNIGNSCYLNSALQALLSCDEFREYTMISNKEQKNISFLSILDDICHKRDKPDVPITNPVLLKQMLSDHNELFKNSDQQDCHECLVAILDIIHEYTKTKNINHISLWVSNNRILKHIPNIIEHSNKQWINNINYNGGSYISHLFSGQLLSNLICQKCNTERNNFEIINNLSLSLPNTGKVDIIDCFTNYFGTEILDNSNSVDCDKCKCKTKHTKSLSLWRFPKIMIIHLKRYTQQSNNIYTRNNCTVDFSTEIIFNDKTNKKKQLVYDLQSIVNHLGMTPMGGHYTSIVKHKNEWVHIDDNIYKYTNEHLVTNSAYILIYKLV